jgi:histidine triad (HIT) family protein
VPCLFCEIAAGKVPARVAYQDEDLVAFHDVNPQAPNHVLVIPRRHITSLMDLAPEDDALIGKLVRRARDLADELKLGDRGFRVLFNTGPDAGYSVYHVHLHLVGGRKLGWPPG